MRWNCYKTYMIWKNFVKLCKKIHEKCLFFKVHVKKLKSCSDLREFCADMRPRVHAPVRVLVRVRACPCLCPCVSVRLCVILLEALPPQSLILALSSSSPYHLLLISSPSICISSSNPCNFLHISSLLYLQRLTDSVQNEPFDSCASCDMCDLRDLCDMWLD